MSADSKPSPESCSPTYHGEYGSPAPTVSTPSVSVGSAPGSHCASPDALSLGLAASPPSSAPDEQAAIVSAATAVTAVRTAGRGRRRRMVTFRVSGARGSGGRRPLTTTPGRGPWLPPPAPRPGGARHSTRTPAVHGRKREALG